MTTKPAVTRWFGLWCGVLLAVGIALIGGLAWQAYRSSQQSFGPTRQFPRENEHTRLREARIAAAPPAPAGELSLAAFYALQTIDEAQFKIAADQVRVGWRHGYTPMLLEIVRFSPNPTHRRAMYSLIDALTGQPFEGDTDDAWRWVWARAYEPHPHYAAFKAEIYRLIDPDFEAYFDGDTDTATMRLDEIRWGGVERDGIPPLDHPAAVAAEDDEADYLGEDDIVFGVMIHGQARAYPKRILGWHEMVKDTVGGVSVNGVYCTLCGSMIFYNTVCEGTHYELGTSGFLYRSNKVMYDHATESMWSTLTGEPTVGPLVGQGIKLEALPVVTTTWGEWRRRHPETTVLSLRTGHDRDYREGEAYRDYFASDQLMFEVPQTDPRLANKAEVLVLRFGEADTPPVVIDTAYLAEHPVYQGRLGGQDYVILTDATGASRVYVADGLVFSAYDAEEAVATSDGGVWRATEAGLVSAAGEVLPRLPVHRAFWFGWYAAHPDTVLIP
ncbi:MAG: DUF3179 domain-containing protein [Planctomycetota bacterium]